MTCVLDESAPHWGAIECPNRKRKNRVWEKGGGCWGGTSVRTMQGWRSRSNGGHCRASSVPFLPVARILYPFYSALWGVLYSAFSTERHLFCCAHSCHTSRCTSWQISPVSFSYFCFLGGGELLNRLNLAAEECISMEAGDFKSGLPWAGMCAPYLRGPPRSQHMCTEQ